MKKNRIKIVLQDGNSQELAKQVEVKEKWCALALRAKPSFFLSWYWIESWLKTVNQTLKFVCAFDIEQSNEAHSDNKTQPNSYSNLLGCGFICSHTKINSQHLFFPNQMYLNRSGDNKLDQMWIEDNDFLLDQSYAATVRQHLMRTLLERHHFSSLNIGISDTEIIRQSCQGEKLNYLAISESESFQKHLNKDCTDFETLVQNFSKNTKHQVRRSRKLLAAKADLRVEIASNKAQAKDWFNAAGQIHQQLWSRTQYGSGFSNETFIDFHHRLIDVSFDHHKIIIAKFMHDEQSMGYIYGFIHNNKFYFYLSALEKAQDAKIKMGLIAHLELMMHLAAENITEYDFMAGTARYKQSLSDSKKSMGFYRITRQKYLFKIDTALRKLKSRIPQR